MTRLYRSTRDKKIFGLCGGLAEAFHIDATILRLIVAVGVVFSGGAVLLLYVVASLVVPKEPVLFGEASQQGFAAGRWGQGGGSQQVPPVPPVPPVNPHHASSVPPVNPQHAPPAQPAAANIDDMMKDIEKKAMQKEIEELKARLAKLEKGDD